MPKRHRAHTHVKAAMTAQQKNHDEIMGHLKNIEQSLQGADGPEAEAPAQPGQSMGDGSSPLGGKAV